MAVRFSDLRTGRPITPRRSLVPLLVRGWVDPTATVYLEGLGQFKTTMNSLGVKPGTCSIVPQQITLERGLSLDWFKNKFISSCWSSVMLQYHCEAYVLNSRLCCVIETFILIVYAFSRPLANLNSRMRINYLFIMREEFVAGFVTLLTSVSTESACKVYVVYFYHLLLLL
jgi:hypothetical protein